MIRAAMFCLAATPTLADTCAPYPWSDAPRLASASETLSYLEIFAPTLRQLTDDLRPTLCLADTPGEAHGSFDPDTRVITLAAGLDPGQTTAILLHELRHLEQNWQGACLSPDLSMRANARAVFALEADAMAITALLTWNLRGIDGGKGFDALSQMPGSADIADAFALAVGETGDLSAATAQAFAAWYGSDERTERYYVASCESYLSHREDTKRLPGTLSFNAALLANICRLPDGAPYACAEPANALPR